MNFQLRHVLFRCMFTLFFSPLHFIHFSMFFLHNSHAAPQNTRCLHNIPPPSPPLFFQADNEILNITLETSEEEGHKLLTNLFGIFLREIIGYESVLIREQEQNFMNATDVLTRLAGIDINNKDSPHIIPESMVNLAVTLPPEIDLEKWNSPGILENCGPLGFLGRYGWFTPRKESMESLNVDYWKSFQNISISSQFLLDEEDLYNATFLARNSSSGRYHCNESYCDRGLFTPQICKHHRHTKPNQTKCGVLIASHFAPSYFLKDQIENSGIKLNVIWLGNHQESFVRYLKEKYEGTNKGVLFFGWNPTLLTTELDLISVSFPPCNNDVYCNYESRKMEKIVAALVKEGAKNAYEAVHRFQLTHEEYINLLTFDISNNDTVESTACAWMRNNKHIWENWKPKGGNGKVPLFIGGIFPISGEYNAIGIVIAAKMAVQAINANDTVLKDYELQMHVNDGQCRADKVMKSFIDYIRLPSFPHMAGILGPACSDTAEPLAGVATHFKTVVISYSAEGSSFSDREKYPYFFRTIGENKQFQYVYLALFQRMKWRRVASLTEEGQKYAEYVSHLHDLFQQNEIQFIANRKFPRERPADNMSQYLQDLKMKRARVIIGDFTEHAARAVMCEAYHQDMTAEYGFVWFLPVWFLKDWYDTDKNNLNKSDPIPCNTEQMIKAINGHLSLQYSYFAPDEEIMQENMSVGSWKRNYETNCASQKQNVSVSDYGGYAYDAMWTYAYALEKLLKQNHSHITNLHSEKTTNTLVKILNETDFHGVSGHIKFIGGPSRLSTIHVVQWDNKETKIVGSFQPITSNTSNEVIGGTLVLKDEGIKWYNKGGGIPSDGSEPPLKCVLETLASALDVSCEVAIVIANVIGFGVLGIILVVCFVVIKRRYDRKVRETQDLFRAMGIDILSATNVSSFDKWEIARDRVVINRKLGEGAFGFVYGGECFLDEKGWGAVAVKTLKVGSSCEQKLDFLSEAEVMKRFDHKNIVRLVGVCTKSEPVYTIMEFMLYGDLKTYLLARRHLVNERNCEESDEVSSKRLTSMALDVARALSYLAELKYVHRDVACRNCLVNASRVVKLGDFGMTRPMYENDYYRFNRKGMLPVRWMAPESLALGIFTPMSDVWSFGVILYEIVTFGSFPFQGKSNSEVLDMVKAGLTLPIPSGVKPQLEGLLKACWTLETTKRPQSSEIVEFLANNPRLISPCLDIPLASVPLEKDESEIEIPDKIRKVPKKKKEIYPGENIPLTSRQSPYATLQ